LPRKPENKQISKPQSTSRRNLWPIQHWLIVMTLFLIGMG